MNNIKIVIDYIIENKLGFDDVNTEYEIDEVSVVSSPIDSQTYYRIEISYIDNTRLDSYNIYTLEKKKKQATINVSVNEYKEIIREYKLNKLL